MDKRELARVFRTRLNELLASDHLNKTQFLIDSGIDRSALSQFLSVDGVRLPRAETLRRMAKASGVSVDWLLNLENAPEGRQEVSMSVQIESDELADGQTPLARWHAEASGLKLRYVPSTLPDILSLPGSMWQATIARPLLSPKKCNRKE